MRHPVPEGATWTWKYCAISNCDCEHTKVCANCNHECDHKIKVCTVRKCNCGRPKVCPILDCNCGYPKIAISPNCAGLLAKCTDPAITAIAKIMERGGSRHDWYYASDAEKRKICEEITRQFSGTPVVIHGMSKGTIINHKYRYELLLMIGTDCVWFFMCAIEFPSDVNLEMEFPEEGITTINATIREMECQEGTCQPILHCD